MHIKRSHRFHSFMTGLALALTLQPVAHAAEYEIQSFGTSAHQALRSIAEQSAKQLVLNAPDADLHHNIIADTAYSAARMVAQDAGYRMRYENNTFTVSSATVATAVPVKAPPKTAPLVSGSRKFSLTLRDTPIQEAFEMLAKRGRINLLVAPEVVGTVSANLYDVSLDTAIDNVARSAGLSVSRNNQSVYISVPDEHRTAALRDARKQVRSFKVQYSDVASVESIMREYLSDDGSLTSLADRRMVIVRDDPDVIRQLSELLKHIDAQPRQILIEAKILEITLTDEETFGVDWQAKRGGGDFGTLSLAKRNTAGMFLNILGSDLDAYLSALSTTGRVRTLSTPKLLVLEDQSAEVVVGDKLGFRVVTTTGNTTSESVQFLESGIILRVKASVDGNDKILLDVHPEVSNGSLVDGLPVQKTTEVTTNILARSGEEIFIGGLLRRTNTDNVSGVPGLSKVPLLGALFRKTEDTGNRTETVVIIKPRLVDDSVNEIEPMAELLETDTWFYEKLPSIEMVSGCVNNHCGY